MYIDTHTHLYDETLMPEIEDVVERALTAGVNKMYMPNCDNNTIAGMMQIAERWPDNCYPMMGLHPCYVNDHYVKELDIVADWLNKHRFSAVGEIGLDYYWDKAYVAQQKDAFEQQIDLALKYGLPIVIHSRESTQDCIDIVRKKQNGNLKGIFHCFSGNANEAKQITELGFYLGIGGVATFKKSTLSEIIQRTAMEYIVLETDAPYLAPVPYRGKRNESSYIPVIAGKIAEIKGMDINEVAQLTTANAEKIFTI